MPWSRWFHVRWWVAALGLPLGAFLIQEALWPVLSPFAWVLFYPAVFWAPYLGNAGSGVVATLLAGSIAYFHFIPVQSNRSAAPLLLFVACGFVFSWFHHRLRRSQNAASDLGHDRRKLETRASEQAALLQASIECISDPFWVYDSSDRLALFNSAYAELSRLLGVEVVAGMAFQTIYRQAEPNLVFDSPEQRTEFRAARLAAKSAKTDSYDFRLKNGQSYLVKKRVMLDGSVVHIAFNRTLERRREGELESARRSAEAANRAKTEFLTSMSHELRTPMNAVLGFAQLLQRDKKTPLAPKHREMVEHVLESGQHLLSLIDDVLDLARIESDAVELVFEAVDLDEALANVVSTLKPVATRAQVQLDLTRPSGCVVRADHRRLMQLLLNLTSNAIKYNHAGGKVTLATETTPSAARISVIDNGMGVPETARERLFEPFHRAGRETGPITGTGIGLTITRRIAELMGGQVGYEPLDPGSLFWVQVPLVTAVEAAPPAHAASGRFPTATARSLRGVVLYVEDNPANLELMRGYVATQPGLELFSAASAQQGLALTRQHRPDLLLLDINLPDMSGLELLQRLREQPELVRTPAIAISASVFPADRARALVAGFDAYVAKPVVFDELEQLLERLLPRAQPRALAVVHGPAQSE